MKCWRCQGSLVYDRDLAGFKCTLCSRVLYVNAMPDFSMGKSLDDIVVNLALEKYDKEWGEDMPPGG